MRVRTCTALPALSGVANTDPNVRMVARMSSRTRRKYDGCPALGRIAKTKPIVSITFGGPGVLGSAKQLDYIMGPKDIRSTTWPVIVKIEERDLRTEEGSERLGGLDPCIRGRVNKFQELVLCSSGDSTETRKDGCDGLVVLQERREEAAATAKATSTTSRNRNKFSVPDEIREMAAEAAKCRDEAKRKLPRKRARREFEAGRAVLPWDKVNHRPVVTKLWINGRAS